MLFTRKLLPLTTALTALMLSAGSAAAQVEVQHEPSGAGCGEVDIDVHTVSGGCVIELQSTEHTPFVAYTPTPFVFATCNWHLEARIAGNGEGYVTQAVLSDEDPPTSPPCGRAPCDEDAGAEDTMIPWPFDIIENGPGDEEFIVELCIRNLSGGEGVNPAQCKVSLDFGEIAGHEPEIGQDPWEEFCEISPLPFVPISIRDAHFTYEEGSEAIEVSHGIEPPDPETSVEVRTEPGNQHCPEVTVIGHGVSGGCHIELESTGVGIPLHANTGISKVTFSNCEVHLEMRVDEDGEGYVNEANLSPPHGGGVPCTRTPCDEDSGATDAMIPWPVHIEENGAGDEALELEFCLRTSTSSEGSPGQLRCEAHFKFAPVAGNHNYEVGVVNGSAGTEVFCENNPPNPDAIHPTLSAIASIEPHLVSTGTEKLEVVH